MDMELISFLFPVHKLYKIMCDNWKRGKKITEKINTLTATLILIESNTSFMPMYWVSQKKFTSIL